MTKLQLTAALVTVIAKPFKLNKTKCVYLINFGIVPYFKEVLRKK